MHQHTIQSSKSSQPRNAHLKGASFLELLLLELLLLELSILELSAKELSKRAGNVSATDISQHHMAGMIEPGCLDGHWNTLLHEFQNNRGHSSIVERMDAQERTLNIGKLATGLTGQLPQGSQISWRTASSIWAGVIGANCRSCSRRS